MIKIVRALKIIYEEAIAMLILVTGLYKNDILSFYYFFMVIYLISGRITVKKYVKILVMVIIMFLYQYIICLTNLNPKNSPMPFPLPFNPSRMPYREPPLPMPWVGSLKVSPRILEYLQLDDTWDLLE